MRAAYLAVPGTKSSEKLFYRPGARHFGVGQRNSPQSMRIAATDRNLSQSLCQGLRVPIRLLPHLAVANFKCRDVGGKPMKIIFVALSSKAGKNMIHAEEKFLFCQVHHQRHKVSAPTLDLAMISLAQVVDADVDFCAAGHPAGHFFADERVRMAAQHFRCVDGIVIGERNEGHAQLLATGIDLIGVIVGLLTNAREQRSVAHS